MKKRVLMAVIAVSFLALTACGGGGGAAGGASQADTTGAAETEASAQTEASAESTSPSGEAGDKTITVGVNPVPHAEILENALKDVLAAEGWELEVVVFQDYVLPNTSLEQGELDANYFQTLGYLEQQNTDAGLHLAALAGVHIEPMGIYSEKHTALSDLADGAEIGIPNDPDNGERALDLLVQKGLLNSKGAYGTDANATFESISTDTEANPRGFIITPLEAASLPLSLPDLDAACINGNYALGANLPADYPAIEIEEFDEETTVKRTNFVVVRQGEEATEKSKVLAEAIHSDAVKQYIDETYKGAVIASFIDPQ